MQQPITEKNIDDSMLTAVKRANYWVYILHEGTIVCQICIMDAYVYLRLAGQEANSIAMVATSVWGSAFSKAVPRIQDLP